MTITTQRGIRLEVDDLTYSAATFLPCFIGWSDFSAVTVEGRLRFTCASDMYENLTECQYVDIDLALTEAARAEYESDIRHQEDIRQTRAQFGIR